MKSVLLGGDFILITMFVVILDAYGKKTFFTINGARYWSRTSDPHRVEVVLYH